MKPWKQEILDLYESIKTKKITFVEAGKKYWVSDNAVRKWFKTEWLDKIKIEKPSWVFNCSHCWKSFIKREWGWLSNNKDKNYNNYCSVECRKAAQSQRWIKWRLTKEWFEELKSSWMSIRSIAKQFWCSHTSLLDNFSSDRIEKKVKYK